MYTPIGGKVLLRELVHDRRSGIILPSGDSNPLVRCEVVAVGPGYMQGDGKWLPCQVQVGDHVYVPRVGLLECEFNRFKYVMTDENRILVVIDKKIDKYEESGSTDGDTADSSSVLVGILGSEQPS